MTKARTDAIVSGLREWCAESSNSGVITESMARDMAACILRQPAFANEATSTLSPQTLPAPGEVERMAIDQNDAMRQELAHVGNLVSDLERAMHADPARADGTWPDLGGRIRHLTNVALATANDEGVADAVTLAQCPPGLFWAGETLGFKSEYGNNEGRIDAFIISSGEFLWGPAPQTIARQRMMLVRPIDSDHAETALATSRSQHEGASS